MISTDCAEIGNEVEVVTPQGLARAIIVEKPFYDPKKQLAIVKVA
jgi:aminomethyltransferase